MCLVEPGIGMVDLSSLDVIDVIRFSLLQIQANGACVDGEET